MNAILMKEKASDYAAASSKLRTILRFVEIGLCSNDLLKILENFINHFDNSFLKVKDKLFFFKLFFLKIIIKGY